MPGNATGLRQPGTALFVSPKPKPHSSTTTDAFSPSERTVLYGRASAPLAQNPFCMQMPGQLQAARVAQKSIL